jgi:dTMP kinase
MTLPKARAQSVSEHSAYCMKGFFVTFEGAEATGKSTQIALLTERLNKMGRRVRAVREPGGTSIGEEIRHTLKHSSNNQAMTAEAELLLMNASRAQLVREVIRPALDAGEIILCDRFYDSTVAYQGYGRGIDLKVVNAVIELAVGNTRPDITFLLIVPEVVTEQRLAARQSAQPVARDRFEEADSAFFARVRHGYEAIAAREPSRIIKIDGSGDVKTIHSDIWNALEGKLKKLND